MIAKRKLFSIYPSISSVRTLSWKISAFCNRFICFWLRSKRECIFQHCAYLAKPWNHNLLSRLSIADKTLKRLQNVEIFQERVRSDLYKRFLTKFLRFAIEICVLHPEFQYKQPVFLPSLNMINTIQQNTQVDLKAPNRCKTQRFLGYTLFWSKAITNSKNSAFCTQIEILGSILTFACQLFDRWQREEI